MSDVSGLAALLLLVVGFVVGWLRPYEIVGKQVGRFVDLVICKIQTLPALLRKCSHMALIVFWVAVFVFSVCFVIALLGITIWLIWIALPYIAGVIVLWLLYKPIVDLWQVIRGLLPVALVRAYFLAVGFFVWTVIRTTHLSMTDPVVIAVVALAILTASLLAFFLLTKLLKHVVVLAVIALLLALVLLALLAIEFVAFSWTLLIGTVFLILLTLTAFFLAGLLRQVWSWLASAVLSLAILNALTGSGCSKKDGDHAPPVKVEQIAPVTQQVKPHEEWEVVAIIPAKKNDGAIRITQRGGHELSLAESVALSAEYGRTPYWRGLPDDNHVIIAPLVGRREVWYLLRRHGADGNLIYIWIPSRKTIN